MTLEAPQYASGIRKHDLHLTEKLIIDKADLTPTLDTRDDKLFLNAEI